MITRWDPFRELTVLQDRVNKAFSDVSNKVDNENSTRNWSPVVDIVDTDSELIVKAEMPGMSREDIDVEVTSDSLIIKGEKKLEETHKDNYTRIERSYGTFLRSFTIGVPVQPDKVKASYTNGVLEVKIPKAEEVKPKKIDIAIE